MNINNVSISYLFIYLYLFLSLYQSQVSDYILLLKFMFFFSLFFCVHMFSLTILLDDQYFPQCITLLPKINLGSLNNQNARY